MTLFDPTYCTREDVQSAGDVKFTARADDALDRAIAGATGTVRELCVRDFLPTQATRYFDWPNDSRAPAWRLWLDGDELISVTTLLSGDTALGIGDYYLEPSRTGPPYMWVETNRAGSAAYASASSPQHAIAITGVWGYRDDRVAAGTLDGGVLAADASISVTDGAALGIGNLIMVDTERMVVTGRTMVSSGETITGNLAASAAGVTVPVSAGAFAAGEVIAVDSERMLVVDVTGLFLTVRRGWDGTPLAAHTSAASITVGREIAVRRGAAGTTAAGHNTAAAVTVNTVPPLVRQLALAEALGALGQESSGWSGGTVGGGEARRARQPGQGIDLLREQCRRLHGRRARVRAV